MSIPSRRLLVSVAILLAWPVALSHVVRAQRAAIGREVSVPSHLQDGQEFTTPLDELLAHGKRLFDAVWTIQEGGGRPLSKGTGRPLADPS